MIIIIIITYIYIYIYIYINVFAALRFLGFHLEQKVNKYIQILSKVYCFLARAHFLLADHISQKHTGQIVKRYHRIPLDFPQVLLTTKTFFSSFASFVLLISLVFFFAFHFCLWIFWNKKYIFWYACDCAGR